MLEKLKDKTFRNGVIVIALIILTGLALISVYVVSKVQYHKSIEDKLECIATITKINTDSITKYGRTENIYISYIVNDKEYTRELGTDTVISFNYTSVNGFNVGDKVKIYYNPQNPLEIATPSTLTQGLFIAVFGAISVVFGIFVLVLVIRGYSKK